MQNILIFYGGPVMTVVTCPSWNRKCLSALSYFPLVIICFFQWDSGKNNFKVNVENWNFKKHKTKAKNNQQTKKALKALPCKMELLPIKSNLSKGVNYDGKPGWVTHAKTFQSSLKEKTFKVIGNRLGASIPKILTLREIWMKVHWNHLPMKSVFSRPGSERR